MPITDRAGEGRPATFRVMHTHTPALNDTRALAGAADDEGLIARLAEEVERRTLMQFQAERRAHFAATVAGRARACAAADLASYFRLVTSPAGAAEMMALCDELTINETTFFRNVPQLDLVAKVAIPEVVARKRAAGMLKRVDIWSAACSTGQEVYTLAILAYEALRFTPGWSVSVFGTDLSPTVLDTARRSLYPKARLDNVPPGVLTRYFDDLGSGIRVREELRRMVSFQQHNLRDPLPPGPFDIIFCRNVMIYFSREEQARLAWKFRERLAPGGFLFIGHSESLQGLGVDLRMRIHERGVVYQKESAAPAQPAGAESAPGTFKMSGFAASLLSEKK